MYRWIGVIVLLVVAVFFWLYLKDRAERGELPSEHTSLSTVTKIDSKRAEEIRRGFSQLEVNREIWKKLIEQIHTQIVGLDELVHGLCLSLLVGGHALVEGLPGLAKTKTIATLALLTDLSFSRIQCTPDLLPSDLTGIDIFNRETKKFETVQGPIFAHLVLVDEINRTTPKVQSALLEAMQERQVTIGKETYPLDKPFQVMATQNPLEHDGTYALPEAQVDRFVMKLHVNYPTVQQEKKMLEMEMQQDTPLKTVMHATDILKSQKEIEKILLSDTMRTYIVSLVQATRTAPETRYGVSPRGSLAISDLAKAVCRLRGGEEVTKKDIHAVLLPVMRHRVVMTYAMEASEKSVDEVILTILSRI